MTPSQLVTLDRLQTEGSPLAELARMYATGERVIGRGWVDDYELDVDGETRFRPCADVPELALLGMLGVEVRMMVKGVGLRALGACTLTWGVDGAENVLHLPRLCAATDRRVIRYGFLSDLHLRSTTPAKVTLTLSITYP